MLKTIQTKPFIIPFIIVLFLSLTFCSLVNNVQAATTIEVLGTSIVADITEISSPNVVWITSTFEVQPKRSLFGKPKEAIPVEGFGSGFFFNNNGDILTNAHVVSGAQSISVLLKDQIDPITAQLIGLDKDLDLAIIRVKPSPNQTYLKLGDSDQTRVGDWAIAIGNPYGLDHTVTLGIISAKGRPLVAGESATGDYQAYENMIQTDAAINPGNSGGPLLNLKGEVIGINTAVSATGQGLGFAIPINSAQLVLDELMTKGKVSRSWLGVEMIDVRNLDPKTRAYLNLGRTNGVLINPVKGSPAAKADLRPFDLVYQVNNTLISSSEDFIKFTRSQKVGDIITLSIIREGVPKTVEVVLEERP